MSARTRLFAGPVHGPTHRSAPTDSIEISINPKTTGGDRAPPLPVDRSAKRRADVPKAWLPPTKFRAEIWGVSHGHRPLRKGRKAAATALASGAERSVCGADVKDGWGSRQRSPPNIRQPRTIPQSRPLADSSCCGAQNSLLADCSQNFDRCHSFLLASSATGGARKRPPLHKGALRDGSTAGGAPSTDRNIARRFYEKESKSLTLRHGPRDLG